MNPVGTHEALSGEVMTKPERAVEMVEQFPDNVLADVTLLCIDPACGTGNLLREFLKQRIQKFNLDPVKVVQSISGCDILEENVITTRSVMKNTVDEVCPDLDSETKALIEFILSYSIFHGDGLKQSKEDWLNRQIRLQGITKHNYKTSA